MAYGGGDCVGWRGDSVLISPKKEGRRITQRRGETQRRAERAGMSRRPWSFVRESDQLR
jgi:hypothetical protein